MLKKIKNPYRNLDNYNCFGCSPNNKIGLKLNFVDNGEEIVAKWTPTKDYEGWIDVLHGGIQATMIDEIASWVVFTKLKSAGVTRELNVRYKKTVFVSNGDITCNAKCINIDRSLATISVKLFSDDILCTEAKVVYYIFDKQTSTQKFFYPGVEEFYQE